jgi:hypothetical protein
MNTDTENGQPGREKLIPPLARELAGERMKNIAVDLFESAAHKAIWIAALAGVLATFKYYTKEPSTPVA